MRRLSRTMRRPDSLGLGDDPLDVLDEDQAFLDPRPDLVLDEQRDCLGGIRFVHSFTPDRLQQVALEPGPVLVTLRPAGRRAPGPCLERRAGSVAGSVRAGTGAEHEVEQVHGRLAAPGEEVAAHRAVGDVVRRRPLPTRLATILLATSGLASHCIPP